MEVAAGTCVCGRALAPHAGSVVCLDATRAMLAAGRREAEKEGLFNIHFVLGEPPFSEMACVLKPGEKLVLIDLEAAEESLRQTEDRLEMLRDPSHVKNLSRAEMLALYRKRGFDVECCEVVKMPMILKNWLDHTNTPKGAREEIIHRMERELSGGEKTGFAPYEKDGQIVFDHHWVTIVGKKAER